MEQSDKLHRLIQAMSRSEKSFFKKYATVYNSQKDSIYIELFDALDAQKDYDERKFMRKYKEATFCKNLSAYKAYLFDSILRSLLAYKAGKDPRHQALELLVEAEILIERGLYDEGARYLEKGKSLLQNSGESILLLRFAELERHLYGIYKVEDHENIKKRIVQDFNHLFDNIQ